MQSEMSILYVLMAVIIFLALMAAIGAWARGGGLKREDAENLFSESQDRHREEISKLQKFVEEARLTAEQAQQNAQQAQDRATEAQSQAAQALTVKLQELDTQVSRTRTDLESAVSRTAADNHEAISGKLDIVSRQLGDSEQRMNDNVNSITGTLQSLHEQVSHAGEQMREALIEIARQQQDQKAQGTIQMCEALITSLGTLKTSIASQLTLNAYDDTPKQMVEAESATSRYETASDENGFQAEDSNQSDNSNESDISDQSDLSDESEKSDISDAVTAHDDDAEDETHKFEESRPQSDTSTWGDAMQLPANDDDDDEASNKPYDTNHDNDNDSDQDDKYPPPIY